LIGSNGAGKSSTLKALLNSVKKTGDINFLGYDTRNHKTHTLVQHGLSLVPEGRKIFINLTVEENLRMGAFNNDENYDALERYPVKDWHGGKVHRIRSHVLHLMRGQVFELEGYHFFTMGGAKSHDTEDGILEPGAPDFERKLLMLQRKPRARYRINHISWWAQEMPSEEEYAEARKNLAKVDWAVDYVITHCAPTSIALMENRHNEADPLTDFLQEVKERAHYHYWLFGHYHDNRAIDEKHILLWEQIVQVI
jgi:ABC-type sugar transport system ATPase subunit